MPTAPIPQSKQNGPSRQLALDQAAVNAAAASSVAATMAAGSPTGGPKLKQTGPNKSLQMRMKDQKKVSHDLMQSERQSVLKQRDSVMAAAATAAARNSAINSATATAAAVASSKQKSGSNPGRVITPSTHTIKANGSVDRSSLAVTSSAAPPLIASSPSLNGSATAALLAFNKIRPGSSVPVNSPTTAATAAANSASTPQILPGSTTTSSHPTGSNDNDMSSEQKPKQRQPLSNISTISTSTERSASVNSSSVAPSLKNPSANSKIITTPSDNSSDLSSSVAAAKTSISKLKAEELGAKQNHRPKSADYSISERSSASVHSTDPLPVTGYVTTSHHDSLSASIATATAAAKMAGATNKPMSVTALPPVKSDDASSLHSNNLPPPPAGTTAGSALAAAMAARTTVVDTFDKINNDVNMKMDNKQKHTKKKRRIYQPAARWTRSAVPSTIMDTNYGSERDYVAPAPVRPSGAILAQTNWMENIPDNSSVRSSSPDRGRSMRNPSPGVPVRTGSGSSSRIPRTYLEEMSLSETLLLPHPWEKELRNSSTDSLNTGVATKNSISPSLSPRLPSASSPREVPRTSSPSMGGDYFNYRNSTGGGSIGTAYNTASPMEIPHSNSSSGNSAPSAHGSTVSLSSSVQNMPPPNPILRHSHTISATHSLTQPSKSPKSTGFFSKFSLKSRADRLAPPTATTNLKSTMRKEQKHRNFNEDKPWKHHMDAFSLTDREKKRYEGLWATNKALHLKYIYEDDDDDEEDDDADDDAEMDVGENQNNPDTSLEHDQDHHHDYKISTIFIDEHDPADDIHGLVVRDIWRRSRLPDYILAQIWDLVDRHHDGTLDREGFLVGMWLVDQCLYGRKLPTKISDNVWSSVGRLNVKIRLHKKERKKENRKDRKKNKKGE